ncbi:NADH dehydrogenase [Mesorhizobium albiziae]|uniref:NADH dehydrogenase n=2 Tax=Neomesorhizobium albiziae TaxID=335020 RepID=A0A1I3WWR9_9HYPH|nr:3-beta-hydroxy-Delta(5)-steroid dehydrogenase [Mesorhizobium albiziae]SFK11925.1 NADH dehydrogenase [Mesorhizobium albiziae]
MFNSLCLPGKSDYEATKGQQPEQAMTTITEIPKLVTVFGGSGFIGRHVVRALARRGYRVRVACRRPDLANYVQPLGNVGQIQPVQANIRVRWSIDRAVEGADHVVNLVGILYEGGKQKFSTVHVDGAGAVAEAAAAIGAGLTVNSAIGASENSASIYARTKARGEQAVLAAAKDAVIFRPSIVFGPEDQFYNRFADMARYSPFLPLLGGGNTRFQPVFVGDVAEAIALSVDGKVKGGTIYELGGPEVLTFRECMEEMLEVIGRKNRLISIPWWLAELQGSILGMLPNPLLTTDQVTQLKSDNVVSAEAEREGRTISALGIEPQTTAAILPSYLWRYRTAGQFTRKTLA